MSTGTSLWLCPSPVCDKGKKAVTGNGEFEMLTIIISITNKFYERKAMHVVLMLLFLLFPFASLCNMTKLH